jgi:hypothetical protein
MGWRRGEFAVGQLCDAPDFLTLKENMMSETVKERMHTDALEMSNLLINSSRSGPWGYSVVRTSSALLRFCSKRNISRK